MLRISKFFGAFATAAALVLAPLQAHTAFAADLPACTIQGTAGNEPLMGTAGADVICTGGGTDTVYGLAGDDFIIVENGGTVTAYLGTGDDTFYGLDGAHAVVEGGDGDDEITGTPGDDQIKGEVGDDTLIGGSGIDYLYGGDGADNIQGEGGADQIFGEAGDDDLSGNLGNDYLYGNAGNDVLVAGEGDDYTYGGEGTDYLEGDAGADRLFGESGTDSVSGGDDDDIIAGGDGVDVLDDGWGLDLCDYTTGEIKGKTCKYDDSAPVLVSASWDKDSYEVSTAAANVKLNLHLTDEVAVRYVYVQCSGIFYGSFSPTSAWTKDVVTTLTGTLPKGLKPGTYSCWAWGYDQVNNYFNKAVPGIEVTRSSGTWDDDAPLLVSSSWEQPSYDVSIYSQQALLNLHLTDATGVNNVTAHCSNDLWASAYSLDGNYAGNSQLAYHSGDAKNLNMQLKFTVPLGSKPGTYGCWIWAYDKWNNRLDATVASIVVERTTGNWDDDAPVVASSSWNQAFYDVGSTKQDALVSLHVTDASSIRNIIISCGVFYTGIYGVDHASYETNPKVVSYLGDPSDLLLTVSGEILLGTMPGRYPCTAWGSDVRNNYFSTSIGNLVVYRTPPGMPSEPKDVAFATASPTAGTLSWTAPDFKGNPVLKDYVIQYSTDNSTWKTINDGYSVTPSLPLSNLKEDTDYWFRVRGENGGGDNQLTEFMQLDYGYGFVHTPAATVPDAPTALRVSGQTQSGFVLNWTAPVNNGGAPLTDYKVELSRDAGYTWVSPKFGTSTSQQFTVTGAAPGTTYDVRIVAVNKVGESVALTGTATTTATTPSKPLNLTIDDISLTTATISWTLPDTNGGSPLRDYKVEISSNGGTSWTAIPHTASNSLRFNLTNLVKGKAYKIRVSAYNDLGYGAVSDVLPLITGVTIPSAPTGLSVTGITSSTGVLNWIAPADNGGSPIIDYLVETSDDNGVTWLPVLHNPSNSLKMTLTNLAAGTNYLVRVSAQNAAGFSDSVVDFLSTPVGPSTAVRNLVATSNSGGVSLHWDFPYADGGSQISDFRIEVSSNGGTTWTAINHVAFVGQDFIVTSLKNGTAYKFRVSAKNEYGFSVPSNVVSNVTPGSAPNAPTGLKATAKTTTTVTLSWTAPVNKNGSAVREFIVEYSKNGGTTWTRVSSATFTSLSLVVKGFKTKTSYKFRVSARNDVGTSGYSNLVTVATK